MCIILFMHLLMDTWVVSSSGYCLYCCSKHCIEMSVQSLFSVLTDMFLGLELAWSLLTMYSYM